PQSRSTANGGTWLTGHASTSTFSKNPLIRSASAASNWVARLRSAAASSSPRCTFHTTLGPTSPGRAATSGPNAVAYFSARQVLNPSSAPARSGVASATSQPTSASACLAGA